MFVEFFHSVIYYPIYNALALAVSVVPGADLGIAIILITILVKLILFPIAIKASETQHATRTLEPKLKELREKHKEDKTELAKATLALYREAGINPFASILILIIQIPIILGLYWVVYEEGRLAAFDPALLYSFVPMPDTPSILFLGFFDLAKGSIVLSLIVAVTQFVQARLLMPTAPERTGKDLQDDLAASMHIQMRYVFPIVIGVIAYVATAAVAVYFITSNIFGIMQEVIARARHKRNYGQ